MKMAVATNDFLTLRFGLVSADLTSWAKIAAGVTTTTGVASFAIAAALKLSARDARETVVAHFDKPLIGKLPEIAIILRTFKDDSARVEALANLLHADQRRARAIYSAVPLATWEKFAARHHWYRLLGIIGAVLIIIAALSCVAFWANPSTPQPTTVIIAPASAPPKPKLTGEAAAIARQILFSFKYVHFLQDGRPKNIAAFENALARLREVEEVERQWFAKRAEAGKGRPSDQVEELRVKRMAAMVSFRQAYSNMSSEWLNCLQGLQSVLRLVGQTRNDKRFAEPYSNEILRFDSLVGCMFAFQKAVTIGQGNDPLNDVVGELFPVTSGIAYQIERIDGLIYDLKILLKEITPDESSPSPR